jgi:plastocyanin
MLKAPTRLSAAIAALAFVLILGLVLGLLLGYTAFANHSASANARTPVTKPPPAATVDIPRDQDVFDPFVLTVKLNTTVLWKNDDTVVHTIITTPDQSSFLNIQAFLLNIAPGQNAKFTFTKSGLYHYYDNTMARWDPTTSRVAPDKRVPDYPLAMDGVIWVQGFIGNLPSGATNHIPAGHDDFASEFTAINDIGTVSFHNYDTDPHLVALVPDLPAPLNPAEMGVNRIDGTDDVSGGGTITLVFNTPGLYYYYCVNHALISKGWHRAQAFKAASEYPIPMEGFILVVGK